MTPRPPISLALLAALLLSSCDDHESKDAIAGLQQRLDTLSAEQTKLQTEAKADHDALAEEKAARESLAGALTAATARIDALEAEQRKARELPKAPERPVVAGRPVDGVRYKVTLGDSQSDGSPDAKVTMVMFTDFQCPFCARADKTVAELQRDYGNDLRIVAKHNPLGFHANAEGAARAAEAAGKQGKYWEMHRKLFENSSALSSTQIEGYAKDLGLDMKRFLSDLDDAGVTAQIEADKKQAKSLGANGTPSWFINGKYLAGAQPKASFAAVIDAEIAEADKLIAAGTDRSALYESLMSSAAEGVGVGR
ncbi:MAG: thioredoxin domain-containing protein [Deltaproteobacteria bacterium]|nr:thioredoxin domain-containing protein [Deltaproteobacteria bacterium]